MSRDPRISAAKAPVALSSCKRAEPRSMLQRLALELRACPRRGWGSISRPRGRSGDARPCRRAMVFGLLGLVATMGSMTQTMAETNAAQAAIFDDFKSCTERTGSFREAKALLKDKGWRPARRLNDEDQSIYSWMHVRASETANYSQDKHDSRTRSLFRISPPDRRNTYRRETPDGPEFLHFVWSSSSQVSQTAFCKIALGASAPRYFSPVKLNRDRAMTAEKRIDEFDGISRTLVESYRINTDALQSNFEQKLHIRMIIETSMTSYLFED